MRAIAKRRGQVTIGGHSIVHFRFIGRNGGRAGYKISGKLLIERGARVDVAYERSDVKAAADVGDACFAYFCEHGTLPV